MTDTQILVAFAIACVVFFFLGVFITSIVFVLKDIKSVNKAIKEEAEFQTFLTAIEIKLDKEIAARQTAEELAEDLRKQLDQEKTKTNKENTKKTTKKKGE